MTLLSSIMVIVRYAWESRLQLLSEVIPPLHDFLTCARALVKLQVYLMSLLKFQ